jgi:hypothetical protein
LTKKQGLWGKAGAVKKKWGGWAWIYTSPRLSSSDPRIFYTYFYNHARHLRFETLLYLELSRSSSRYLKFQQVFKPLLDPGGRFASETAARRFQNCNGRYVIVQEALRLKINSGYM